MDTIQERWIGWLDEQGIQLNELQLQQFEQYYKLLVDWNQRMNLTGITERAEVYEKHFYDSLTIAFQLPFDQIKTVIDVGSGAGFPGLPLKIAFPHLHVTILDALSKRITFLEHVADTLALKNINLIHGRAEDKGQDSNFRQQFDVATARAVARMNVLAEYCAPFVKKGGWFAAMKGTDPVEEMNEGKVSFRILGMKFEKNVQLQLPAENAQRHIVLFKKIKDTPKKYPRKAGTPVKQPIQ